MPWEADADFLLLEPAVIAFWGLVSFLDPDPLVETETEPRSSVPGLNHLCCLGFFKFTTSFFCRLSSFSKTCIFLVLLAAANKPPPLRWAGCSGRDLLLRVEATAEKIISNRFLLLEPAVIVVGHLGRCP